jgi:hypothetical protein
MHTRWKSAIYFKHSKCYSDTEEIVLLEVSAKGQTTSHRNKFLGDKKKSRVQFNIDQRQTDREAVYTQTRKYNDQIRQKEANFCS